MGEDIVWSVQKCTVGVIPRHTLTKCAEHIVEMDEVTIAPDLNTACKAAKETGDMTELNLYYVAVSRCKKSLIDADEL